MDERTKQVWLVRLIDTCGFSYKEANKIVEDLSSELIVTSIMKAYNKGKVDATQPWGSYK